MYNGNILSLSAYHSKQERGTFFFTPTFYFSFSALLYLLSLSFNFFFFLTLYLSLLLSLVQLSPLLCVTLFFFLFSNLFTLFQAFFFSFFCLLEWFERVLVKQFPCSELANTTDVLSSWLHRKVKIPLHIPSFTIGVLC